MPDAGNMRARYRRIVRFAAGAFVQTWWYELVLARIGFAAFAERTRAARMQRLARRFHGLAVDLGGLMIKVGQFMSSRLDVLPPDITDELAGLQDEVPPVPFADVRAVAEAELGVSLERAFAWFDESPVAAASLGQAHRARLAPQDAEDTGFENVIVKVQRPRIDEVVEVDLSALRRIAGWLSRVRLVADRVDMPGLVEEFAQTSIEEVDYRHEARNAARFAQNAAADARVRVPEIAWERSSGKVLTLEDVSAIKIRDVAALRAAGIDPAEVASEFAAVMFDQFFEHGFFHADPHPGNLFVTPGREGGRWRITFVDFGMMGEVPDDLRAGLRRLVVAVAARDGSGLVAAMREMGVLLPSAQTGELEQGLSTLFARFGGLSFAELQKVDPREFQRFGEEFGETVRGLPIQLPENFLLIIRAVSLTSGLCSALDPDFNVWEAVEPFATKLLRAESGSMVRTVGAQLAETAAVAWRLPYRIDAVISRVEDGRLAVDLSKLDRRFGRLEGLARRLLSGILFAGLLIAGVLLRAEDAVLGTVLMSLSALPLLHAIVTGFAGPRGR